MKTTDPQLSPDIPEVDDAYTTTSRNPLKRLYFWMLRWAKTKHATPALFGFSFAESSFFPIPPDVLLMALCFSEPRRWLRFAFWCSLASVLGGLLGYYIGFALWETVGLSIVKFYHGEAVMERIQKTYSDNGFIGILIAAITPIPYKVFTIASGVFKFNLLEFTIASIVGRSFRFFAVAGLIRVLGERVRPFIEQKLEWFMMAFGILLVLGFVALKFLR